MKRILGLVIAATFALAAISPAFASSGPRATYCGPGHYHDPVGSTCWCAMTAHHHDPLCEAP